MIFRPNARARDRMGSMSESSIAPYESPIQGYIDYQQQMGGSGSGSSGGSSQVQHWQEIKVVSTENSGSPFTSDKCTDGFIPSMLAAKNYVDSSVAGKKQGAAVGLVEAEGATIAVVPGVKSYVADFSAGSATVAFTFDLAGISGAFGFDLWVTPSEGYAVAFPAGVVWFDSMGPVAQAMRDSDKRYLFRFDSFDGETVYGRFVGSVDKEA